MKSFALVLGGGGARGIAHIPVLEALDEMGVRPAIIAGASIGAPIGAAYAAGMSGKDIRRHAMARLHDRGEVWRRLMAARVGSFASMFSTNFGNPVLLDGMRLASEFLPEQIPASFEELSIPLVVTTTDLYARCEKRFAAGPLLPAIAASMALPGVVRPIEIDGRILVDGAAVNPLPFDCVQDQVDVVLAVDTAIGPTEPRGIPDPWDALFSTIQLMGQSIVAEKLKQTAPDIVIRPNVSVFRLFDFFNVSAILRVADAVRGEVKEKLAVALAA